VNDDEIWKKFVEPQWDEHLKHSPEDGEPGYRACPKCFIEIFKKGYTQGRKAERKQILQEIEDAFELTEDSTMWYNSGDAWCDRCNKDISECKCLTWGEFKKRILSGERGNEK